MVALLIQHNRALARAYKYLYCNTNSGTLDHEYEGGVGPHRHGAVGVSSVQPSRVEFVLSCSVVRRAAVSGMLCQVEAAVAAVLLPLQEQPRPA